MRLYYNAIKDIRESVDVKLFNVRREETLVPNPEAIPAFIGREVRRYVTANVPPLGERFIDPDGVIGDRYDPINDPLSLEAIDVSWEEAISILDLPEWEDI